MICVQSVGAADASVKKMGSSGLTFELRSLHVHVDCFRIADNALRATRRRVFAEQRPARTLCRWCSQCASAADRAARHRNTIRSSQFRRSSASIEFGRSPAQLRIQRQAGFPRGRSLCRQKRHSEPSPAHFAQLADFALQVDDHLPIRQPAIVQPFRERGQLARGAS